MSVPGLSLHLFTGPASSFDGAALEFAIAFRFLDHLRNPLSTVVVGVFAVGKCICQVSAQVSVWRRCQRRNCTNDLPNDAHGGA